MNAMFTQMLTNFEQDLHSNLRKNIRDHFEHILLHGRSQLAAGHYLLIFEH